MDIKFKNSYQVSKNIMKSIIDNVYNTFNDNELIMRFNCYMTLYRYIRYHIFDLEKFEDEDIEKLVDIVIDIFYNYDIPSYITIENIIEIVVTFNTDAKEYLQGIIDIDKYKNFLLNYLSGVFNFKLE